MILTIHSLTFHGIIVDMYETIRHVYVVIGSNSTFLVGIHI